MIIPLRVCRSVRMIQLVSRRKVFVLCWCCLVAPAWPKWHLNLWLEGDSPNNDGRVPQHCCWSFPPRPWPRNWFRWCRWEALPWRRRGPGRYWQRMLRVLTGLPVLSAQGPPAHQWITAQWASLLGRSFCLCACAVPCCRRHPVAARLALQGLQGRESASAL